MASSLYRLIINVSFVIILTMFTSIHLSSPSPLHLRQPHRSRTSHACKSINTMNGYISKCSYVEAHHSCTPSGFIDYLAVFYCVFGNQMFIGYTVLFLWLLILFYLLGNTASLYFCSSLEGLSKVLGLHPTLAGVTLLALGNGAPDVFASFVSFAADGSGEVGISSVLGGAFFVSTVVVGVISVCLSGSTGIDRSSFIRDAGFLIAVLCTLFMMLLEGKVSLISSVCFASLYVVYVVIVSVGHCCREKNGTLQQPLLNDIRVDSPTEPLLDPKPSTVSNWLNWVLYLIELPLYLPRRLTIPDVSEERWSKSFAVASATLSPVLLATLWGSRLTVSLLALLVGLILGVIAMGTTENSRPPSGKLLLPWLAGGFLMSVAWTYITAGELVALLVAAGRILDISPEILGLTVLAWGNSLGDLIANVAMALSGGDDGVQIAISGCYAGPIFNTLVGLGMSMVLSSWKGYPVPVVIDHDGSIYETVVFLIVGLLWAIVVLPRRGMKVDRLLGTGLLVIYLCYLCLRLSKLTGFV